MKLTVDISNAKKSHAPDLACLINMAGEGMPEYLWESMAEGNEKPLERGAKRAAREEGEFSYKHARVSMQADQIAGMLIAYQQPNPYDTSDIDEYPDFIRPLVLLEAQVPGSWYINALAVYESFQRQGIARQLLLDTEKRALAKGCSEMSIIVASTNVDAKSLYNSLGFVDKSALPVIPINENFHRGDWVLMTKGIGHSA
ncbi:MAG: GNAT family N-acetyltransferase [Cellvibrionaceae bacterium]